MYVQRCITCVVLVRYTIPRKQGKTKAKQSVPERKYDENYLFMLQFLFYATGLNECGGKSVYVFPSVCTSVRRL